MDADRCRALLQRYYLELWNEWRLDLIDEILAPDLHFRGSMTTVLDGRDDFRAYLQGIRVAMPDFRHEIEWIVAESGSDGEGAAAARILYSGTHEGDLFGVAGTGHRVNYQGAAFLHMRSVDGTDTIHEIWTLGDMSAVRRQILGPAAG